MMLNMFSLLIFMLLTISFPRLWGQNQTSDLSPIFPPDSLPFTISITLADFQLPSDNLNAFGIQSFAWAVYQGKALLIAGRTNGLHGFDIGDNNFPPRQQNTIVYVVDPDSQTVATKSLLDPSSQLSQSQIDALSVTASQYFQVNNTLYIVGGYGVDTPTLGRERQWVSSEVRASEYSPAHSSSRRIFDAGQSPSAVFVGLWPKFSRILFGWLKRHLHAAGADL